MPEFFALANRRKEQAKASDPKQQPGPPKTPEDIQNPEAREAFRILHERNLKQRLEELAKQRGTSQ